MNVARIINDKGRDVFTVSGAISLADAVAMLAEKRIGALVVVEGTAIRGILSERDIVRAVAKDGAAALAKQAAEFMTVRVMKSLGLVKASSTGDDMPPDLPLNELGF